MNPFVPIFDGDLELGRIPNDFAARLHKRVEDGFLVKGQRSPRVRYTVRSESSDEITLAAGNFLTAYNVGLNNVSICRGGPTSLHYHVSYWRWTLTAVVHGLILGFLFLAIFAAFPGMREQIAAQWFGLSIFTGLLVFFCLLWPWILTAIHRPIAEKTLQRILREVMA